MIVRDKPSFWELAFVLRGSLLLQILPQIVAVGALSLGVVTLQDRGLVHFTPIAPLALTVIGSALAIFSSFRNVSAYDRWWEARRVVGQMVSELRGLVRESRSYIADPAGDELPRRIALRCIAFLYAERDFLRDRPLSDAVARYLPPAEAAVLRSSSNPPNRLLDQFSVDIAAALAAGRVPPLMAQLLENRVSGLTTASSNAERTKATPMPFAYTLLVHRTAYAFCFLLPFGLAASSGFWTPLIAAVVTYTFFGLDAIGDALANPYAADSANTMPLDAVARTVEINILEALGETDVPAPLTPTNYVLT